MRNVTSVAGMLALLILFFLAGSATAGDYEPRVVEESGPASSDGLVIIENMVGSIKVIGWDKDEVHLDGTLGEDVEDLKFETGRKKSRIKVVYPRKSHSINDGADLIIRIPRGSSLEVEGISADILVEGVEGNLELSSISGKVEFSGWCRKLEAGSISGRILIDGGAKEMELECVSGDIKASGKTADIDAETVSGGIQLEYDTFLELSLESVSGTIRVTGDLADRGSFDFDAVSGDVILTVPADVSAEFEVTTFSGGIDNAFGQKSRKTSRYAPGRELEFAVGEGDAQVEINSFSGDVVIKKN